MPLESQHVVVLGASPKPERYAYQAVQLLLNYGHYVYPVHPKINTILEQACYKNLASVKKKVNKPIGTLTLYVGTARLDGLIDDILALAPQRIICNPGTEHPNLTEQASKQGIDIFDACTLVMLKTNQF